MADVNLWWYLSHVPTLSDPTRLGNLDTPCAITPDGSGIYKREFSIATNTTQELFDVADGDLADFDLALILVNKSDVVLELTIDANNGVGDENFTFKLRTGSPAGSFPNFIPTSIGYANYQSNFAGGTLDKIDRIRARNLNANTATLLFVAWD